MRLFVRTIGTVKHIQASVENQFLLQFAQEKEFDIAKSMVTHIVEKEKLPWFLFYEDSIGMRAFKFVLGTIVFYQFTWLALYIALDDCKGLFVLNRTQVILVIVTEILCALDMTINFLTIRNGLQQVTLANTAMAYIKGHFFFDFLAVVVSNAVLLISVESFLFWGTRLKLIRILRREYMLSSYRNIVALLSAKQPKIGKVLGFIIPTFFEAVFWLNILTCIWIKLGSLDCREDRWLALEEEQRSWMFIEGTDFNGDQDQRTIYEQIKDETTASNIASLYIYALYWVLTVLTTVGYGHATYYSSYELLYACVLELFATLVQAYSIATLRDAFKIKEGSFEQVLTERMQGVDEWMVFKIQAQQKPCLLPTHLTMAMYESFKESFSNDFNMIVEEFNFY